MKLFHYYISLSLILGLTACAASPSVRSGQQPATGERSSSDLTNRLATLERAVVVLQRQIDSQAHRLQSLDGRVNENGSTLAEKQPTTEAVKHPPVATAPGPGPRQRQAARDYLQAFSQLTTGRYPAAESKFERFMQTYPDNRFAGNALFWLAECRLAQRQLTAAADTFRQVPEDYPTATKAPEALLKLAQVYRQLGRKDQAARALSLLKQQYPQSSAAERADSILL